MRAKPDFTEPLDINIFLSSAQKRIDELSRSEKSIIGLPSGFIDLDKMTSGFQNGDLIIVAGRPSMGKTSFAMNIATYVASLEAKKTVLIFSMEMPGDQLAMRLFASMTRIGQNKIRTGKGLTEDDWNSISSTVGVFSNIRMFVDDTAALTPVELSARARRISRMHGDIGLIVIDYLQLMQVSGFRENRTAEITEISRSLKALAKELNAPVIALSQLNRSLEMRQNKRPVMSDLRESGAIEQDADLILFIYRDEVYNEDSSDKGKAEIIIGKQRNGPIGKVDLTFLGQYTLFENFTKRSPE